MCSSIDFNNSGQLTWRSWEYRLPYYFAHYLSLLNYFANFPTTGSESEQAKNFCAALHVGNNLRSLGIFSH